MKNALHIPADMTVITLVMVGIHSNAISSILSDKQVEAGKKRPMRLPLKEFAYMNGYKETS